MTERYSRFRRAPWHVGHGTSRMNLSSLAFTFSDVVSWYFSKMIERMPENLVNQYVSRPSRVW